MKAIFLVIAVLFFMVSCKEETTTEPKPDKLAEVTILNQVWMTKNLDVEYYCNGDVIPQVTDPNAWSKLTTGAWCYYNNDPAMGAIYGKLYNWYAVNDPRGLAPIGWHVPSDAEWTALITFLGGEYAAGGKLKEAGTLHWLSPNTGATDEKGFSALPGGNRVDYNGKFEKINSDGGWWSSSESEYDAENAIRRFLYYRGAGIGMDDLPKGDAFSVRCIKNNSGLVPIINSISPASANINKFVTISGANFSNIQSKSYVTFNTTIATEIASWSDNQIKVKVPIGAITGKVSVTVGALKSNEFDFIVNSSIPNEVSIGQQIWLKRNLDVVTYRNGDTIPQVTNPADWSNLTTGAWCYINNDPALGAIYGKLYNWYAVNDPRGLAPAGWHVPSDEEWTILTTFIGGEDVAGYKLKEVGTAHWDNL